MLEKNPSYFIIAVVLASSYNIVWLTDGIKTTERKHRTVVLGHDDICFNLQVKFYDNDEVEHYTGHLLKSVRVDVERSCSGSCISGASSRDVFVNGVTLVPLRHVHFEQTSM